MKNKSFFYVIAALFFVLGINFYFFELNDFGNRSIFNILLFICCIHLIKNNQNKQFPNKKIPLLFSAILSFSMIVGRIIYKYNNILILFKNLQEIIYSLVMMTGFTIIISEILCIVFEWITNCNIKKPMWKIFTKKYAFIGMWGIIFLSWIPAYLSYFPGVLFYDASWQTAQAMGIIPYSQIHPPIHTYLWQICIDFGEIINIEPLVIYSILQMLFLSFVLTKFVKMLIDKRVNNYLIVLSLLFFTINPVLAVFSFSVTKDICFAAFLFLFTMEIIKIIETPNNYLQINKGSITFIIISLLMCLFRNNAIYVYIITAAFIFVYLKKYLKQNKYFMVIPLLLFIIVTTIIYPALGVEKGNSREGLSVPIQQIARVVSARHSELDNDTKKQINKFLSYDTAVANYNPRFADVVKETFNSSYFDENKLEFAHLWFKLFLKYPGDYLSSFLSLNLAYWYIDSSTIDPYSNVAYIETGIINNEMYHTEPHSLLPSLYNKYSKVVSFDFAINKPFVVNIFSITTPFWLMLFTIFILIYKKQFKEIIIVLPGIALWLTHMAGPVSNFRYIFPIFIQYPLFISLIFYKGRYLK